MCTRGCGCDCDCGCGCVCDCGCGCGCCASGGGGGFVIGCICGVLGATFGVVEPCTEVGLLAGT